MRTLAFLLLVVGTALGQPILSTTPYTRSWLKSADAGLARTNLGIYSTNDSVILVTNYTYITNTFTSTNLNASYATNSGYATNAGYASEAGHATNADTATTISGVTSNSVLEILGPVGETNISAYGSTGTLTTSNLVVASGGVVTIPNMPIPTNSPATGNRIVATSATSARWITGNLLNTLSPGVAPNLATPYSDLTTNQPFTFMAPLGISTTEYQTAVVLVTNSSGTNITITAPANCHQEGTSTCTNVSACSFFNNHGWWTNLIVYPLW